VTHDSDISPLTRLVTRLVTRLDRVGDRGVERGGADAGAGDVLPTGFPSLDRAIGGGFRRGDLVVLGGDDSMGCSALALAVGLRQPHRSLLLTGERLADRVYERALALSAKVPLDALRFGTVTEEERRRLASAATMLRDRVPVVDTLLEGGMGPVERALAATPTAPLVIVDPLESLLDRAAGREEMLGYAIVTLKRLALRHQLVVLLLTHLPGFDPARRDRRPRLADFGLGGAVGQQADLVLGLYREELYEADLGVTGAAELQILKHRDGPRGYVDLYFDARYGRFEDVLEE